MFSRLLFLFLAIGIDLDLSSLNCILFCLAQFSIFASSQLVYASASDVVWPYVRIGRSSAKATLFCFSVSYLTKTAVYFNATHFSCLFFPCKGII
jgi:hypothetical protein